MSIVSPGGATDARSTRPWNKKTRALANPTALELTLGHLHPRTGARFFVKSVTAGPGPEIGTRQDGPGKAQRRDCGSCKGAQDADASDRARYRLSTSSISLIAIRHRVHAQAADPKKVRAASKLIQRGMPLRHVAQTVGLGYQRLRHLLEKQGVYKVPPPNKPWSEREVRILRRDYGEPGRSLRTIAAKLGRTCQGVNSKAALLGLRWPLEFRASAKGTSKLSDHQQAEALKCLAAGESCCRAIARTFHVRHSTISRLASSRRR